MKRRTYNAIQSGRNFLLIMILIAILFIGGICGTLYAIHYSATSSEMTTLQSQGMVHLTTLSDESKINVVVKGAQPGNHTLVTIGGMGYQDYGIYMDYITSPLQTENRLVIVDRLGTGMSDDTSENRTAQAIVEEYRTALQKNMIDGPYVLLAHEIGAAYATLWQSTYPSEIEGIVYVDPNPVNTSYMGLNIDENAQWLSLGCKIGLQRLIYDKYYTPESARLPSSYVQLSSIYNSHSLFTSGYLSEVENATKNFSIMDTVQPTDIPKMYINCSYAFETREEALTYVDYMNAQARSIGQDKVFESPEVAADICLSQSQEMTSVISTIVNRLGNCSLVKMPGGATVYEQHHGVLQAAILDFVDYLDGETPSLKDRYVDGILEEWQQKQKEQQLAEAQEQESLDPENTETESES